MNADIQIVLIETSHPGNIGAAARAMKTMALQSLVLVRPHRFPHADADAMACGAGDILQQAKVVESLEQAVADCSLVVGTSARSRTLACPQWDARQTAAEVIQLGRAGAKAAIVFGRERTGLTNQELECCNALVHLPANPDYSSLNVAAAVQVLAYELRMASLNIAQQDVAEHVPAPMQEMERFYEHLHKVLVETGFLDPNNPRLLMRRLRHLFGRAAPDQNEVNILRGVLAAINKHPRH